MQTFLKTVLPYVFCILAGYLAGAVNFAWLLAKKRGFDIRTKGSGNAGTTNAGRTMGSGVAAVVFLCDALKSALMVWLAGFLFHSSPSIQTVTMAACVAGHLYPFYLEFQGGKGIAVLLGSALALDWRLFLILVAGVAVITFITDYMFIGTLSASVGYLVWCILTGRSGWDIAIMAATVALIFWSTGRTSSASSRARSSASARASSRKNTASIKKTPEKIDRRVSETPETRRSFFIFLPAAAAAVCTRPWRRGARARTPARSRRTGSSGGKHTARR